MRFFTGLLLVTAAQISSANQMAIEIGKDVNGFNVPFVSVTVCEPKTEHCRTIDRIKLDTGSEGLRLYKSALEGLTLPISRDSIGYEITLCSEMAGGPGYWGPAAKADLILGDEKAPAANVQVVDPDIPKGAARCNEPPSDGRKGILGMGSALVNNNGTIYYSCGPLGCTMVLPKVIGQVANPISYLKTDNNGFIVSIPKVDGAGQANIRGKVIFGIGTRPNNQPPASHKISTCRVNNDDAFTIKFNGKKFRTQIDTGTNSVVIPKAAMAIQRCGNSERYLCPNETFSMKAQLQNRDGASCGSIEVEVGSDQYPQSGFYDDSWVRPRLASTQEGLLLRTMADSFTLGLPSFYGRDIYYGFEKKSSPLGKGPLVAF